MRRRMLVNLLAISFLPLLCAFQSGPPFKVQAPYDSFVCFDSSFEQCLISAQSGEVKSFRTAAFDKLAESHYQFIDPEAGQTHPTGDNKYTCDYRTIAYKQAINTSKSTPVVFVSPVLLQEIDEQTIRLSRARDSCLRLVQAYDYEQKILSLQDGLSLWQQALTVFTTELEHNRNNQQGSGARGLTGAEAAKYNLPVGRLVRDVISDSRNQVAIIGEELRTAYKDQTIEVVYKDKFSDANQAIELELLELSRSLFILDRSVSNNIHGTSKRGAYAGGSWVKQGTVVLTFGE